MIRKDNTKLSLTRQCKLLKISRSSIYYTPVGVNAKTLALMHEIDRVFTKYPFFGSRQIAAYLPQSGFSAGRHRVRRLMNLMGLQAIYKGPNTSKKHPQHRIYPYLLRKLAITIALIMAHRETFATCAACAGDMCGRVCGAIRSARRIAFAPCGETLLNAGRIQIDRLAVTPLAERIGQLAQIRESTKKCGAIALT
jgi:hypothetical protein